MKKSISLKALSLFLVLASFSGIASAQEISIESAITKLSAHLPNIPWTGRDYLNFSGTTADGSTCKGYFYGLNSDLTIELERDLGGDKGVVTTTVDLNKDQTIDSVSTYVVLQSVNDSANSFDLRSVTHLPAQHGDGMPLPATRMNQEMKLTFNADHSLHSVEMTQSNYIFRLGRTHIICNIQGM